jgi:hypothetical protein
MLKTFYNRLPKEGRNKKQPNKKTRAFTKKGSYKGTDKNINKYMKEHRRAMRFYLERPILPIGGTKFKTPMNKKFEINKYTEKGRSFIHKNLTDISEDTLNWLRTMPVGVNERATVALYDNRISLYVAQKGKCHITGETLNPTNMVTHHKKLWSETKDDSYKNLVLVTNLAHKLIHLKSEEKIIELLKLMKPDEKSLGRINKLRNLIGNEEIKLKSKRNDSPNDMLGGYKLRKHS